MSNYQIFVRTLDDKTVTADVNENDTVNTLKNKISGTVGLAVNKMMLMFGSKQLNDGNKLKDYSIQKGCTVMVIRQLQGGF